MATNETTNTFLEKAARYVQRGMAVAHDSEQEAYWLHFAVEPLLRAAVAHVHPALLADPKSDASLLMALGVATPEVTATRSRPSGALVKLLGLLDAQRFGPDFARRINTFIERRNVARRGRADGVPWCGVAT